MPRRIDYLTRQWSSAQRFGEGEVHLDVDDYTLLPPLSNTCHTHTRISLMKDHDYCTDARANKVFEWVQNNAKGIWHLDEHQYLGKGGVIAKYYFDEEADSDAFQAQWGELFTYTEPRQELDHPLVQAASRAEELHAMMNKAAQGQSISTATFTQTSKARTESPAPSVEERYLEVV